MRVIWNGVATSATRRDPVSGQPLQYRLVIYDDGQATCSCPGFTFMGLRNPKVSEADRMRVRCKHLQVAFDSGPVNELLRERDELTRTQDPMTQASVGGPPTGSPQAAVAEDDDDPFEDDDFDAPHRLR